MNVRRVMRRVVWHVMEISKSLLPLQRTSVTSRWWPSNLLKRLVLRLCKKTSFRLEPAPIAWFGAFRPLS